MAKREFLMQEDHDSPPSANTRNERRGPITQDYMLHMIEQAAQQSPFSTQQAASCHHPLRFLHDTAAAILDEDTGKLLEYRHLMKHPKYKDVWMKSFAIEIRRLVLAGNVGDMSATCRRRVKMLPILARNACRGRHTIAK